MNIQEAVKESLRTKKTIKRKNSATECVLMPTNTYDLVVIWAANQRRLPCRGWQPSADDLIADDWCVTDIDYQNLILFK